MQQRIGVFEGLVTRNGTCIAGPEYKWQKVECVLLIGLQAYQHTGYS